METPLLTIVTINYNNASGLKQTIESVLSQKTDDYSLIEYLIVDGASKDESITVIKEAEKNKGAFNFIWSSETDSGIYNAMNKGIARASGKYVYMLNSGDYLEPDVLSVFIERLKKDPDLLLFEVNLLEEGQKLKTELRYPNNLYYGSMYHQGMIYKKDFHEKNGKYDENYRFASDYDFSMKAFYKKNLKIESVYKPCVNFLCGGVGGSEASMDEIYAIKVKNGIIIEKKKSLLKTIIKCFIPYGLLALYKKMIRG